MTTLGERCHVGSLIANELGAFSNHVKAALVEDLYSCKQRVLQTTQVMTTSGSPTVTFVCAANHFLSANNKVTISSTSATLNGIPAVEVVGEQTVAIIDSATNFTIITTTAATSGVVVAGFTPTVTTPDYLTYTHGDASGNLAVTRGTKATISGPSGIARTLYDFNDDQLSAAKLRLVSPNGLVTAKLSVDDTGAIVSTDQSGTSSAVGLPSTAAASADDALTYTGSGLAWRSPSLNLFNYISNATPTLIGQAISGANANDQLSAVDISNDGTRIVVGARQNNGNGYVQVYDRQSEPNGGYVWAQLGSTINGSTDDMFGFSVAIAKDQKDLIVIGATHDSQTSVSSAGKAYVYQYTSGSWAVVDELQNRTANASRNGFQVAISDDGLVVAFSDQPTNTALGGQVKVVRYPDLASIGSGTAQTLTYVNRGATEPDRFGHDLQLSADGSRLAVSTPGLTINSQTIGGVYLYDFITSGGTSQYSQIQFIIGPGANDGAGESVALSGDGSRLAIGLPYQNSNVGVIYIYHYDVASSSFGYNVYIAGSGSEVIGLTSGALALNNNGHRLVVGSTHYDDSSTNRGRVLVFEYNGQTATWGSSPITTAFIEISGDNEANRNFGSDTAITSDGRFIITSAINDDNVNGVNAGLVKIYQLPTALTSGSLYYSSDNIIRIVS